MMIPRKIYHPAGMEKRAAVFSGIRLSGRRRMGFRHFAVDSLPEGDAYMRTRLLLRAALFVLAAALALPIPALAANAWRPYDPAAFAKAREAGRTVFVSVYADW